MGGKERAGWMGLYFQMALKVFSVDILIALALRLSLFVRHHLFTETAVQCTLFLLLFTHRALLDLEQLFLADMSFLLSHYRDTVQRSQDEGKKECYTNESLDRSAITRSLVITVRVNARNQASAIRNQKLPQTTVHINIQQLPFACAEIAAQ